MTLFGGPAWAFEDSTLEDDTQRLRLVLRDGKRIDAVIDGHRIDPGLPEPDGVIRFSAAIAAARFGRGSIVLGLQRLLPVVEACLEEAARAAAMSANTTHQRSGGPFEDRAVQIIETLNGVPDVKAVTRLTELYGQWRTENDPPYRADWAGLRAVIARGQTLESAGS